MLLPAPQRLTRRSLLATTGAAFVAFSLSGCRRNEQAHLNFYNWDTYIGEHTLEDFQKQSGTHIRMSLFANNDELFAKLRGGNQGYDVIMPSNDFVERMSKAQMLMPLDHSLLPNYSNIAPEFQNVSFDPGRRFSMPYTWLALGIGYRKSAMPGFVPDSWKWVLDSDRFKGRIGLLAESPDLYRLSYKYMGLPMNSSDPAHIKLASAMLLRQKPNIALFHNDEGQALLQAGDIDIVIEYNGDVAQVMQEDSDLDFVIPREGSELNSDCMCIPKGAPNPDLAHRFINFMLDAHVHADVIKTIQYPTPNRVAASLMDDAYRNNPVIYPPPAILAKCEYAHYLGEDWAHAVEDAMTEVRAG